MGDPGRAACLRRAFQVSVVFVCLLGLHFLPDSTRSGHLAMGVDVMTRGEGAPRRQEIVNGKRCKTVNIKHTYAGREDIHSTVNPSHRKLSCGRLSHGRLSYGRLPHGRLSHERTPCRRLSHGRLPVSLSVPMRLCLLSPKRFELRRLPP